MEVLGSEEVKEENGIKPGNIASLLGDIAGIQIQQTSAATGNAPLTAAQVLTAGGGELHGHWRRGGHRGTLCGAVPHLAQEGE